MNEEKLTRAAIVTGGSRGIGRAVCVALAKQGCNVVVNYCHGAEPAEQTAALCRAEGVQAVTVQAMYPPPRAARHCSMPPPRPLAGWMCW